MRISILGMFLGLAAGLAPADFLRMLMITGLCSYSSTGALSPQLVAWKFNLRQNCLGWFNLPPFFFSSLSCHTIFFSPGCFNCSSFWREAFLLPPAKETGCSLSFRLHTVQFYLFIYLFTYFFIFLLKYS